MKTNLKTLALALVASFTFAACAEKPADAPKMGEPMLAAEAAAEPVPENPQAEPAPEKRQAKARRPRRAKKEKCAAPASGTQKQPRRRRTRKTPMSALPVTGMLDSAE